MAEVNATPEDRFDIRYVLQHFQQSLKVVNANEEDVNLREYLLAYRQLNKMFPLLHRLFGFIASDVSEKCGILEEYLANKESGKNYESVRRMLEYEKELHVKKESKSESTDPLPIGARTLLRLHRALEYVCRLLKDIANANDHDTMGRIAKQGYDETLGKYHPWLVRQAAHLAMYTLPYRKQLLERFSGGEDISEAAHWLTEASEAGYRVFQIVQVMYAEKEWLDLP